MCGIAGIYAYREAAAPVDEGELLRIREAMIHRGPDGAGLWVSPDRRVGLGHRRLAIIDLSEAGAQPMATAGGNFRVSFNGMSGWPPVSRWVFHAIDRDAYANGQKMRCRKAHPD